MKKPPRKKWGTNVAVAKPFTICESKFGQLAVRIGTCKPFATVDEVSLNAGLVIVTSSSDHGVVIKGEGVVRRHGRTIAITP